MIKIEGYLAGKEIITYASKGGKKYSPDEIGQFLRKFQLSGALRLIGELSYQIFRSQEQHIVIKGILVSDGALAYIAMRLVEKTNDYHSKNITLDELLKAIDMYYGLTDPVEVNNQNAEGSLIRFGATQFDYDRELRHTLPRTLILYRDLWNQIEKAGEVDINRALNQLYGLKLEEILFFGFLFSSRTEKGFFRILDREEIEQLDNKLSLKIDWQKQSQFVNRISSSYQDFRTASKAESPPTIEHEKFRFNPLITTPAIVPDRNPQYWNSQVYITPIPRLLFERVTRGLYFELADHFRGNGKNNPFRTAFGSVFQEYVGLLLKKAVGENKVRTEWRYGSQKKPKDTPDWLIIEDKRAILIEVKQSGIYLEAKKWGDLAKIQDDLKKTIGSAVKQLWEFEQDIKSGYYSELNCLSDVEIVEKIVVIYDSSYFLNSTLRDRVRSINPNIPDDYHWHTISIADFEYFIGIAGNKIFYSLEQKRINKDNDVMDFRDYYARICSQDEINNPYLSQVYDSFFDELGLKNE